MSRRSYNLGPLTLQRGRRRRARPAPAPKPAAVDVNDGWPNAITWTVSLLLDRRDVQGAAAVAREQADGNRALEVATLARLLHNQCAARIGLDELPTLTQAIVVAGLSQVAWAALAERGLR